MNIYFKAVGCALILLAVMMLLYRIGFVVGGRRLSGKVIDVVYRQSFNESGTTRSKYIKVNYLDSNQIERETVVENALLVYLYKPGDTIKLAEKNNKVLVNTLINLLCAPVAMCLIGFCAVLV